MTTSKHMYCISNNCIPFKILIQELIHWTLLCLYVVKKKKKSCNPDKDLTKNIVMGKW